MQTNTHGPLRIVNLIAKKARKPVSFVHMSTAYVGSCEPSGTRVMETLSHVNIPPPPPPYCFPYPCPYCTLTHSLPQVNIDPEELIARIKTMTRAEIAAATPGCPPPLRTNRTRRIPHPVLSGHAASLTPY